MSKGEHMRRKATRYDRNTFGRTAVKTKKMNIKPFVARGGERL